MALGINTNVASLNAQRNLTNSQSSLNTSLQRLSTGLRINSAKDDAAGLAIATRFTTQINGLNQAVRNANDGVSLAQTGESSINEITNNLQRIRELAIQSANATNSASDRSALDQEVQQRLSEISRIAGQTTFNGQKILDGTFGNAQFQVGANVGDTVSINLSTGLKSSQLGQIATGSSTTPVTSAAIGSGDLAITIGGAETVGIIASVEGPQGAAAGQSDFSAFAKVEAINSSGVAGLTATATNVQVDDGFAAIGVTTGDQAAANGTAGGGAQTFDLTINGVELYNIDTTGDTDAEAAAKSVSAQDIVDKINQNSSATGVTAEFDGVTTLTLTAADGRDINIEQNQTGTVTGGIDGTNLNIEYDDNTTTNTNRGSVTLTASENITLSGGVGGTILGFASNSIVLDNNSISNGDVTTVANSNDLISRIDASLTKVSDLRSTFGAIQQRFESITVNLQTISENLSASRSRILDADFAAETASLTKSQILQQAGISVLSQANAIPQNVLALLQ